MTNYKGLNCPYCEKQLEGADNVVCPVCGTPHHRECYKQNGVCFNDKLHDEGFEFDNPNIKIELSPLEQNEQNPNILPPEQNKGLFSNFMQNVENTVPITDKQEIDGIPVEDWVQYIGPSTQYYLYSFAAQDKFKRKTAFTWSAAFIPLVYFIYRKLWSAAAIMFAIEFICSIPSFFYLFFWQAGYTLGLSETFVTNAGTIGSSVLLFFNLLCGVFAVYIYRTQSAKRIKKLKKTATNDYDYRLKLRRSNPSYANIIAFFFGLMFLSTIVMSVLMAFGYEPPMELINQYANFGL